MKQDRLRLNPVFVFLLCASFGLSANAQAQEKQAEAKDQIRMSGFLGDYSELQPHPDRKEMLIYLKSEDAVRPYSKFIIDPILIYFHPEAKGQGVDPDELKKLTDYFRDEVMEKLDDSEHYQVVENPAPGVLRVRFAITDVIPVGKGKNVAAKAAGAAVGAAVSAPVAMFVPRINIGKASVEVELVDAVTGERIMAAVDSKRGRRFFTFFRGKKKWGDVKAAFRDWAKIFRNKLDEIHGY